MQLKLNFTADELASIKSRAEALGMRPVHFGRAVLLAGGHLVIQTERASSATGKILVQLSLLGHNLNQLVRHLHMTNDPLPADLEPLLADIRAILTREQQR